MAATDVLGRKIMRLIVQFSKLGLSRFISHLDLQTTFARAIRRSSIAVKFSQGFNPHIILSFASALSVGIESIAEVADIALDKPIDVSNQELVNRLNDIMPKGIVVNQVFFVEDNYSSLTSIVTNAKYEIKLFTKANELDTSQINNRFSDFISKPIIAQKKGKKKILKEVDLQDYLTKLETKEIKDDYIVFNLECMNSSTGSLNPLILVPLLINALQIDCDDYSIMRTALINIDSNGIEKNSWELAI